MTLTKETTLRELLRFIRVLVQRMLANVDIGMRLVKGGQCPYSSILKIEYFPKAKR